MDAPSTKPTGLGEAFARSPAQAIPAAWTLVGVLIAVHIATAWAWHDIARGGWMDELLFDRGRRFRFLAGGQLLRSLRQGDTWRLCTSVLLHGNALHLAVNATALIALGRLLEPIIGPARWLGWFALGGVAGSALSWATGVRLSDGASGGAFALLGAATVLAWRARTDLEEPERWVYLRVLPLFALLNLALSLAVPAIDAAAHIGGLIAGLASAAVAPSTIDTLNRPSWINRIFLTAFGATCLWGWFA